MGERFRIGFFYAKSSRKLEITLTRLSAGRLSSRTRALRAASALRPAPPAHFHDLVGLDDPSSQVFVRLSCRSATVARPLLAKITSGLRPTNSFASSRI